VRGVSCRDAVKWCHPSALLLTVKAGRIVANRSLRAKVASDSQTWKASINPSDLQNSQIPPSRCRKAPSLPPAKPPERSIGSHLGGS